MFDLGWDEMLVIGVVALIVLGPKELPNALRTVSTVMKNARKLAGEFQSGVNEIIREADLEDARKKLNEVQALNKNQIQNAIEKAVDPEGAVKAALAEVDPTGPAPTETTPVPTLPSGEDDAVEIAAAKPVTPEPADPDVTPAPERIAAPAEEKR